MYFLPVYLLVFLSLCLPSAARGKQQRNARGRQPRRVAEPLHSSTHRWTNPSFHMCPSSMVEKADLDETASSDSDDEPGQAMPADASADLFGVVGFAAPTGHAPPGQFVSLSGLPKARWVNLSRLELIKERNRPVRSICVKSSACLVVCLISEYLDACLSGYL
jgi:hypothetical protein